MNENVIKFRKPEPPKRKQPRTGLRKLLVTVGIAAFFVGAWAYFQYIA